MLSALYYPHIEIQNPSLIKTALLLWDRIEYIAPYKDWRPYHDDQYLKMALELIAKPHVPTDEEKKAAHDVILELANSPLPPWFFLNRVRGGINYNVYPEKLLPETWGSLRNTRLVREKGDTFTTSQAFGFSVMSILADCCAGTQKQLITDETKSYSALNRYLTNIGGGEYGTDARETDQYERLITISLKTINVDKLDIRRLISARESEARGDVNLRSFRQNYLNSLKEYINKMKEVHTQGDRVEIERVFEQKLKDDLKQLKDALKIEMPKTALTIFGEGMAVAAIASPGVILEHPALIAALGVGTLLGNKTIYRAVRNKTLQGHSMSWLYLTHKRQMW